jgi:phosphoenolpyruvate-protein kinase (PTS system EI component)
MAGGDSIQFRGKQVDPDAFKRLVLERIAKRQAPDLGQQLGELGLHQLQSLAHNIEGAQPSKGRLKKLDVSGLVEASRSVPEEMSLSERVRAGQQVVLRGTSRGAARVVIGDSIVLDPDIAVVKIPFDKEDGARTAPNLEEYVRARVRESQEQLRTVDSDLSGISLFTLMAATAETGAGQDMTILTPFMKHVLNGFDIEVSDSVVPAIERDKPTYPPLFTVRPASKEGRMLVHVMGAIDAVEFFGINAAWAAKRVAQTMALVYEKKSEDPGEDSRNAIRDRADYVVSACIEILANRLPEGSGTGMTALIESLRQDSVIAARNLPLTMSAAIIDHQVGGLVFERGGCGSHSFVFSEGRAALFGVHGLISGNLIGTGIKVILDDEAGICVLNPTQQVLDYYLRKQRYCEELAARRRRHMENPVARTRDGVEVRLCANMEFRPQIQAINDYHMPDIGLLRSEGELLRILGEHAGKNLSTAGFAPLIEDGMFKFLKYVVDNFQGRSITIRDMDVAGRDKPTHDVQRLFPGVSLERDFMGGLDFIMYAEALHKPVLRAILRAAAYGSEKGKRMRLLVPMVSDLDLLGRYKQRVRQTLSELRTVGNFVEPPILVMFENPESFRIADALLAEANGGSVGTNDAIHFLTSIPRDSEEFPVTHPAVVAPTQAVTQIGERQGKLISVCGEMGFDPIGACLLVLAGVRILSGSAEMAPEVKELLANLDTKEHAHLLQKSIACTSRSALVSLWSKEFPPLKAMARFEEPPPFEIPPETTH